MTMPAPAHTRPDHDETLIAQFAADDVTPREAADAGKLVGTCPACAQLHADLRSIMAVTAGLPAPRRTRDFLLTEAGAARLRRTGWRRLISRFGEPRLAFTRPLATGLVALGLAGLVFAAAPTWLAPLGSSSAAAPVQANAPAPISGGAAPGSDQTQSNQFGTYASPAASVGADLAQRSPAAASVAAQSLPSAAATAGPATSTDQGVGRVTIGSPPVGPVEQGNPAAGKSAQSGEASPTGPSSLVLISLALVLLGAGLFLLRWVARRTA